MRFLCRPLFLLSALFTVLPAGGVSGFSVEQVYHQMMSDLTARRNEQLSVRRVEKIARGVAGKLGGNGTYLLFPGHLHFQGCFLSGIAAGLGAQVKQEWR